MRKTEGCSGGEMRRGEGGWVERLEGGNEEKRRLLTEAIMGRT